MYSELEFPFTRQYPMPLGAYVYPSPEGGVGVRVRGSGNITMTFEKPDDPGKARVKVEDIFISLPFIQIPFDIDRDGFKECIELHSFEFGSEVFNLDECGGELNLETGEIFLNFQLSIPADLLQPLSEKADIGKGLRINVKERGYFNPVTGEGQTFSELYTVQDGPFEGLTIMGDQFGEDCKASLAMGAWLLTPASSPPSGLNAYQANKNVYKHKNTPVMLLWQSSSAGSWQVEIKPDLGTVQQTGFQKIPDLSSLNTKLHRSIDRDITYDGSVVGGVCGPAFDKVDINVKKGDEYVQQTATFRDQMGAKWYTRLDADQYDQNLKIYKVIIDTGKPDSVQHPDWHLDHKFPGDPQSGTNIPSLNNWTFTSGQFSLPGDYFFKPMPQGVSLPGAEYQRVLYFRLLIRP